MNPSHTWYWKTTLTSVRWTEMVFWGAVMIKREKGLMKFTELNPILNVNSCKLQMLLQFEVCHFQLPKHVFFFRKIFTSLGYGTILWPFQGATLDCLVKTKTSAKVLVTHIPKLCPPIIWFKNQIFIPTTIRAICEDTLQTIAAVVRESFLFQDTNCKEGKSLCSVNFCNNMLRGKKNIKTKYNTF